jgi:hypothetical protein
MLKFKTIKVLNLSALNKANRRVWDYAVELEKRIAELENKSCCKVETIVGPESIVVIETEEEVITEDSPFDWAECEDAATLKAWAKEEHALEIKGNKKPETIKQEIADYLSKEAE